MAAWQERKRSADVMELLLRNGADPNARNVRGSTPLHHACQNGHEYAVMLLLDRLADCDVVNAEGDSPLTVAARYDRKQVVSLLCNHHPQLVKDTRALREAAKSGRKEIVKILLNMGMDCLEKDPATGDTALHEACRFYRVEVAECLLGFGADAHAENNAGETPLSLIMGYEDNKARLRIMQLFDGACDV